MEKQVLNLPTILIALVLAAAVALIIVKLVRDKKKGKTNCGGSCEGCAYKGSCHK